MAREEIGVRGPGRELSRRAATVIGVLITTLAAGFVAAAIDAVIRMLG